MARRVSNKKAKRIICSVLNRFGNNFEYIDFLADPYGLTMETIPNTYQLRQYGAPYQLSKASRYVNGGVV